MKAKVLQKGQEGNIEWEEREGEYGVLLYSREKGSGKPFKVESMDTVLKAR